MLKLLRNLRRDDAGLALIEYMVALAIVISLSVAILQSVGGNLNTIFSSLSSSLGVAATGHG